MEQKSLMPALLGICMAAIVAQPVMAQSGLEASKQLSNTKSNELLFKDDPALLEKLSKPLSEGTDPGSTNDLSPPTDPSATQTYQPPIDPYLPEGGPLTLLNCGTSGISVKTFNSNDAVMWVPFQTVNIGSQRRSGLRCATSSCKLHIGGLRTGAISGYQVFIRGRVLPTNKTAMDKGCGIY